MQVVQQQLQVGIRQVDSTGESLMYNAHILYYHMWQILEGYKILVNWQMVVNSPKFNLTKIFLLKYFECRAEVIRHFITTKHLVSKYLPKFYPSNILQVQCIYYKD